MKATTALQTKSSQIPAQWRRQPRWTYSIDPLQLQGLRGGSTSDVHRSPLSPYHMPDEGVIFRGSLQQANTARPWHAMTIIPHRLDPMMSTRFLPLTTTQTTHTASCRRRRQAGLMIRLQLALRLLRAACCVQGVLQCNTWCRVQDLGPWLYVACGPGRIIQMQLRLDRGLSIISLVVGRFASQKFTSSGSQTLTYMVLLIKPDVLALIDNTSRQSAVRRRPTQMPPSAEP